MAANGHFLQDYTNSGTKVDNNSLVSMVTRQGVRQIYLNPGAVEISYLSVSSALVLVVSRYGTKFSWQAV